MTAHPAASIFPLMFGEEFQQLCESIRENGQREPIKRSADGRIIDGRNRYQACELVGIEPLFETIEMDDQAVMDFVIDENLHRRHLDATQKAMVGVRILEHEKRLAKERQREGGKSGGRGRTQKVPAKLREPKRDGEATARVAKRVSVGETYVREAVKIATKDPEAGIAMASGEKTLHQVKRQKVEEKRAAKRAADAKRIDEAPSLLDVVGQATFSTVVLDPPWDYRDESDIDPSGALPNYATMTIDELRQTTAHNGSIPISTLVDDDSHLYLWITNRSLPKGFDLLESWGFRYVTTLTWVKPSIGLGKYFRGQTEHVLFGVKGSQPLLRKDVGTVFSTDRPKEHSMKPEEFFSLVESCSPGPYLEIFARRNREGWSCWGNEWK